VPEPQPVAELHADAEHEGADDQRRSERRDGAAIARPERRHRHHRERCDGDDDQAADQTASFTACEKAPPRRGVAELGLEKGDAEAEAAENQRRGSRLAVEQNQRDEDRSGEDGDGNEEIIGARRCGRWSGNGCSGHVWLSHHGGAL